MVCVDGGLAAFLKFPVVDIFTEANGGYKKFGFLLCFNLLLYVHGEQLGSCRDDQLLIHTVPGQVSRRQLTSIKFPFFASY